MAPRAAAIRQTCCCFNVRIATTALAIYHVVSVQVPWAVCVCVCVCVCVRQRASEPHPHLLNPLEWEHRCSPPLRRTPARPFPALRLRVPLCPKCVPGVVFGGGGSSAAVAAVEGGGPCSKRI